MLRMFVKMLCVVMLVLGCVIPAGATMFTEGDSATFSFDFSSSSPGPPYDDVHPSVTFDAWSYTGNYTITFFDDWSNPGLSTFAQAYVAWGTPGPLPREQWTIDYYSWPTTRPVLSTLVYGTFTLGAGSLDLTAIALAMSVGSTLTPFIQGEAGTPVPEPGTLLLLGSGLAGLGIHRHRRWKRGPS